MYDVLELLLKIRTEGLDSLDKTGTSVRNIGQETQRTSKDFQQFENLLKTLTGAGNTYREAVDQIAKGTSGAAQSLAKQIQAADKDFQALQRNAERFEAQQTRLSERQAALAARQVASTERDAARAITAAERRAAAEERATDRIVRTLERRAAIASQVGRAEQLAQERIFALSGITNPAQAQRAGAAFSSLISSAQQRAAEREAASRMGALERLGTMGASYAGGLPLFLGRGAFGAGLALPLAGLAGAALAGSLVHSEATNARGTVDLANRLDLPVGQTRDLQNEAKLAGVNVSVLESSVRSLSSALEDSSGPGKKASEALSKLGINTIMSSGEVREMGPVLTEVIDKLSQIPSKTERAHEGEAILGRSYKEIEPLIEKHRELSAELDKFGLKLDANLIQRLSDAETKFSAMGIAFDNLKAKLAGVIEPIVIPVVIQLTKGLSTGAGALRLGSEIVNPSGILPDLLGDWFQEKYGFQPRLPLLTRRPVGRL